jgi:hypothetical protein
MRSKIRIPWGFVLVTSGYRTKVLFTSLTSRDSLIRGTPSEGVSG